jgi:hypothetical protein
MWTDASAGVPAGTEKGVRRTYEYCALNCMPPTFGSRKNVWMTPAVDIGGDFAIRVRRTVVAKETRLAAGLNLGADQ